LVVKSSDAEPYAQAEAALRGRLVERSWAVRSDTLKTISDKGIQPAIAHADCVVAIGTPAARWLHEQLPPGVRLVYCMVTHAEEAGLLGGRPSCGVTTEIALAEQVRIIAEALPQARTIGTLYRADATESRASVEALRRAIPGDWRIEAVAVNEFPSASAAIDALVRKHVDIVWTTADPRLYDTACVRTLLLAALRSKVPVWGFSPAFVHAGAMLGAGVEPRAQGAQAADLVLHLAADPKANSDPAQRYVQQGAREFQIAVNLIVARQLGVQIPDALAHRAAYVYRPEN
jgi:ABC-type uncharacterized transport system substrate-binding protein